MSRRAHLRLRVAAAVLLAAMALWPRTRGAGDARATPEAHTPRAAAQAETTTARLAGAPRTTKLVVATAGDSRLTN